jgi:hypothetical protein
VPSIVENLLIRSVLLKQPAGSPPDETWSRARKSQGVRLLEMDKMGILLAIPSGLYLVPWGNVRHVEFYDETCQAA